MCWACGFVFVCILVYMYVYICVCVYKLYVHVCVWLKNPLKATKLINGKTSFWTWSNPSSTILYNLMLPKKPVLWSCLIGAWHRISDQSQRYAFLRTCWLMVCVLWVHTSERGLCFQRELKPRGFADHDINCKCNLRLRPLPQNTHTSRYSFHKELSRIFFK